MKLKVSDLRCPTCKELAEPCRGSDIYPHRPDLARLRFYRCPKGCDCYAGTHSDGKPKAQLATKETREARIQAHAAFDRLWKGGLFPSRSETYKALARWFKQEEVHIGWMSVEECDRVMEWAKANGARQPKETDHAEG